MEHHFNTELAKNIGIKEAVIISIVFENIYYNKAVKEGYYNGEYWETSGIKSLYRQMSYINERTFFRCFTGLVAIGILKKCKSPVSCGIGRKSYWYTFTEKGWKILNDYHII